MTQTIRIESIACQASIGVFDWEHKVKQNLLIDLCMEACNPRARFSDSLADTIDYKALTSMLIAHCQSKHFGLIELLVEELVDRVMAYDSRIVELQLQVRKIGALRHAEQVSVTSHKQRAMVIVGIGSNIDAHANISLAIQALQNNFHDICYASVLSTKAVARPHDPDFLNTAVSFRTPLDRNILEKRLKHIEYEMGRERGNSDSYSPRIIDLDLVLYNDILTDGDLFVRDFLQQLVEEISPGMLYYLKNHYAMPILVPHAHPTDND